MDNCKNIRINEYNSIRNELLENKRFIFERPLVVVAGILVLLSSFKEPIVYLLSTVAIFLLIYNLNFSINRFKSSANMSAYISRFHEGDLISEWFGWENYLYYFRMFANDLKSKEFKLNLKHKFKKRIHSKYLFNYHRIYKFHLFTAISFVFLPALYYLANLFFQTEKGKIDNNVILLYFAISFTIINGYLLIRFYRKDKNDIVPRNVVNKIEYYYDMCDEILKYKMIKKIEQKFSIIGNQKMNRKGTLIILACHCVYDKDNNTILAEHPKDRPIYEAQIQYSFKHLEWLKEKEPLLVITGGFTKNENKLSESESYIHMAEYLGLKIPSNVILEKHALVSIENLLYSLYMYHKTNNIYPERIDVISWNFKRERYYYTMEAINNWRKLNESWDDFNYYSVGDLTKDLKENVVKDEYKYIEMLDKGINYYFKNPITKEIIQRRDVFNLRTETKKEYKKYPLPW